MYFQVKTVDRRPWYSGRDRSEATSYIQASESVPHKPPEKLKVEVEAELVDVIGTNYFGKKHDSKS
jgi:hypothetical protein